MKVGVFGDSYACLTLGKNSAWFENKIITDRYDLVSFAKKGSDITWAYNKFIENHRKFKKNIFFVTEATRHSFKIGLHTFHISNIESIDLIKKDISDFRIKNILNSLKDHYLYTMSMDLYDFGLAGMVEKIKEIRPDTIIIFGFYNSSLVKITGSDFYLSQVSLMELEQFGIDFEWMKKVGFGEGRSAHLTDENNIILARYLRNRLDDLPVNNLSINDFYKPSKQEVKKYFPDIIDA